ncbi:MAG: hypothetical protein JF888_08880 [Candidatus Dormibacteraeota bacterium]|uniref:Uncharacterized protein n=1 Tax=Candidatus Dormiibacter inghamiae TaxID=3127013 RepID=A0A934KJP2_9BACT|nr:hypothetical protein [Candidatus Dormibacteraeota bacterium]MBJ7606487.1 hypothetical protein [Candidatus Dormibacteraeota bacterium]
MPELKRPDEAFKNLQDRVGPSPKREEHNEPRERVMTLVPQAIPIEYWQEEDGSWAAHSPILGVTAAGDTDAELFAEMAEQVDDFWQVLNERYLTLGDELRNLLQLRHLGLKFDRKSS